MPSLTAMRLLHTLTLQPEQFLDPLPPYAILSHRWGDDEVKFDDLGKPGVEKKAGFAKIAAFCTKAASAGFQYGWVDTCCIDKRSSSELTEAINSMFQVRTLIFQFRFSKFASFCP